MASLLSPLLMGPAQRLSPMAGPATGNMGAFPPAPPVPSAPQQRGGGFGGLGGLFSNARMPDQATRLQMAAQMMSAPTFGQSMGGAFGVMGQGMAEQRAKQEEQQRRNATLEYFKRTRPDLYEAVSVGMDPKEAFKMALDGGPDLTSNLKEYQFAREQGFDGSFTDYQTALKKAGATNVTVGDGAPGLGKLSSDYGYVLDPATGQPVIDPQTGLPRAAAIPGSPAAQEAEQVSAKSESKEEQQRTWNLIVNEEIERALNIVEGDGRLPTTGFGSETMAGVGGTAARDLKGLLDTIKANAGFDRLQAMRDSSPTGGALGQVSERELAFLQSTIGNLEQSQSKEQVSYNLKRLKKIYDNMLNGKRAYDGLLESSDGAAKEGWQDLGNGVRIRRLD